MQKYRMLLPLLLAGWLAWLELGVSTPRATWLLSASRHHGVPHGTAPLALAVETNEIGSADKPLGSHAARYWHLYFLLG